MLNDSLSNALSVVLNADKVGKQECIIKPTSKVIKEVLTIMHENRYIGEIKETIDSRGNYLKINLLSNINKCGSIKPRFAVQKNDFEKFEKRYLPAKEMGVIILSTPKGIVTLQEARKKGVGGRLLAYCY